MKRSFLLFTALAGFGYLTLTSYSNGPAAPSNGGLNRTGGPGSSGLTCSQSGCHGPNTTSTSVQSLQLFDNTLSQPVPGSNPYYIGGHQYTITIGVANNHSPIPYTNFGFQLMILNGGGNQLGSIVATDPKTITRNVAGRSILEQTQTLNASTGLSMSFDWTAPAAGSGPMTIYGCFNAVNKNNQADIGDEPGMPYMKIITETPAGVSELSRDILIAVFPNPATDHVNLKFADAEYGLYSVSILDLSGRKIYTEDIKINSSTAQLSFGTSGWTSGLYFARVIKDGAQRLIPIVKN